MKLCLRCNQYFEDNIEQCPTDQTGLESVGKDPLIGALINNRYLVDSVIGKGSSGIVYRATRLGRGEMVVAIKVLHSFIGAAGSALDRFLREAQSASQLRNPHIITIWESGVTEDGQPYFVMDYLEGITLGRLIREKGQLEPNRVLSILRQTCEALGEAHRLGITHRDLKPENIILQQTGQDTEYVKLLDFGIADSPQHSMLSYKLEKPRTVSGSPAYMSPEQCQGFELDGRSDIYSLAIVVFEMLTGSRPFARSENVNVMVLHVSEAPLRLADVRPDLNFPAPVENVIARALSKQPSERQPTIQDFFTDLETAWQFFGPPQQFSQTGDPARSTLNRLQQVVQANPNVIACQETTPDSFNRLVAQSAKLERREQVSTRDEQTVTGTSTRQRLIQAAQKGRTNSKNNVIAVNNIIAPSATGAGSASNSQNLSASNVSPENKQQPSVVSSNPPAANGEETTPYFKQRQRTTISRLQGWKKTGSVETRAIVSTRAKAASIKAETVRKPINVWNIMVAVTTLLCLGTSFYVIYAALRTNMPSSVSVQSLSNSGKYEQVRAILEQKQLIAKLSPRERDQLSLAYLNLAKVYQARHEVDQALLLLTRIDPESPSAEAGQRMTSKLIKLERKQNSK